MSEQFKPPAPNPEVASIHNLQNIFPGIISLRQDHDYEQNPVATPTNQSSKQRLATEQSVQSQSIIDIDRPPNPEEETTPFSFDGFQVVRGEYFAHINEPSITISDFKFSVNMACLRKASSTEFVQVLMNPEDRKLVIRPCQEDEKDSFQWCTPKRKPRQVACRIFYAMIVTLLDWNTDYRYKIIGKQIKNHDELLFVFDLKATEIYQRSMITDETGMKKHTTQSRPVYPEDWKNQFGLPIEEHRRSVQVNIYNGYAVFGMKEPKRMLEETSSKPCDEGEVTI